jgi:hypothetical protein
MLIQLQSQQHLLLSSLLELYVQCNQHGNVCGMLRNVQIRSPKRKEKQWSPLRPSKQPPAT